MEENALVVDFLVVNIYVARRFWRAFYLSLRGGRPWATDAAISQNPKFDLRN